MTGRTADAEVDWVALAEQHPLPPEQLAEVLAFLAIPSVSGDPRHTPDVERAAGWVRDYLRSHGAEAELVATKRDPLVVGRIPASPGHPDAPTVLLYAHFDVQPEGDPEAWVTGPFDPQVRDGWIHARGSADDKLHLFALMRGALDLAAEGALPVNVMVLGDAEEEATGDTVVDWVEEQEDLPDLAVAFDGIMFRHRQPVIQIATRGICFYRLEVGTGSQDLHSGIFGGVGLNALHVLVRALAAVTGDQPTLEAGGYRPVAEDLADWQQACDWEQILATAGGRPLAPEVLDSFVERTGFRPSVNVHGISGGEPDLEKTIIPVRAHAHLSIRLAPRQDPDVVGAELERIVRDAVDPGVDVRLERLQSSRGSLIEPGSPPARAIAAAVGRAMGGEPVLQPTGGTVPIMSALAARDIPAVLTGFGLPESNVHAPNERFPLAYVAMATDAVREILVSLAGSARESAPGR